MMSLLRLNAIALLLSGAMPFIGSGAVAEPLDKQSCASLQNERKQLFNADMQAALEQGPDWVKKHLTDEAIERVRRFLSVEEQIQFRCRGGGVPKPAAKATDAKATDAEATDGAATDAATVPLPDRKPTPPSQAEANASLAKP
ncbi:MAG: hypothetical protein WA441_12385 [Methyloceanibacter sp.]|jgi:hypothetical protein